MGNYIAGIERTANAEFHHGFRVARLSKHTSTSTVLVLWRAGTEGEVPMPYAVFDGEERRTCQTSPPCDANSYILVGVGELKNPDFANKCDLDHICWHAFKSYVTGTKKIQIFLDSNRKTNDDRWSLHPSKKIIRESRGHQRDSLHTMFHLFDDSRASSVSGCGDDAEETDVFNDWPGYNDDWTLETAKPASRQCR